jgi:hypothetical protein
MPNAIKYKTGNLTGSLQKGNVALGVTALGPTETTGFYNGYIGNPTAGRYIVYEVDVSNPPKIYYPANDAELIRLARQEGATGAATGSATAVISWMATQTNLIVANREYENIVTDGLILNIDAGFVGSYPTSASTWYDLSRMGADGYNGTLTNGPVFSGSNGGQIVFDGVDDFVNLTTIPNYSFANGITIEIIVRFAGLGAGGWERFLDTRNTGGSGNFITFSRFSVFPRILFQCSNIVGGDTQRRYISDGNVLTGSAIAVFAFTMGAGTPGNENSNCALYKNGAVIAGSFSEGIPRTPSTTTRNQSWIARSPFAGNSFLSGSIYQQRIYNRGLSAAEILQNYNAMKGRYGLS